jgi:methionine-rich copper-binding protein CopC
MRSSFKHGRKVAALAVGLALMLSAAAFAHAILVEAAPAAKSTVAGPDVAIRLRFNSRIDAARSHLSLLAPDGHESALAQAPGGEAAVLTAKATGLTAGAYRIRWQVLAADGHITRGEIPFRVK